MNGEPGQKVHTFCSEMTIHDAHWKRASNVLLMQKYDNHFPLKFENLKFLNTPSRWPYGTRAGIRSSSRAVYNIRTSCTYIFFFYYLFLARNTNWNERKLEGYHVRINSKSWCYMYRASSIQRASENCVQVFNENDFVIFLHWKDDRGAFPVLVRIVDGRLTVKWVEK